MKFFKKTWLLLILFALEFNIQAIEKQPLKVGMELSYPPFETIDLNGKPKGISVDIAFALGKYLNREVKIENIPFIGLIPSLKTNKIDLIISSMTATEERSGAINFSKPYLLTGLCLLISLNSPLQSIQDANQSHVKIVVKAGTSGEVYANKYLRKAKVIILEREASCVLEIVQGKADAFIYDQLSTYTNWQKNLTTTRAALQPFQKEPWAMGIRKEDRELKNQVNQFIKYFRESGGFEELGNKYFFKEKQAFKKMGIPFVF